MMSRRNILATTAGAMSAAAARAATLGRHYLSHYQIYTVTLASRSKFLRIRLHTLLLRNLTSVTFSVA